MKLQKIFGFGILVFLLISSLSVAGFHFNEVPISTNALIRIDTTKNIVTLPENVEIIAINQGEWVDIIIPCDRVQELIELQIPYSVLIADMNAYHTGMMGSYHTLAQV